MALNINDTYTGTGVWERSVAETIDIKRYAQIVPSNYFLEQNFPNPFNSSTIIKFDIPKASSVQIKLYEITREMVSMALDDKLPEGVFTLNIDATNKKI
ncbi:MAG: hypothetical protein ACP5P3_00965 [Ignavibacteria bacterium]